LTDQDLITKKLAYIETCVSAIRTLVHPEEIRTDILQQGYVKYTLQTAIQAALDAAAMIVSDQRLGEPKTNRDLFEILVQHGWLPQDLDTPLRAMVGFRNILVHGYQDVDMAIVEDVVQSHLDDLLVFVRAIRERLSRT
jgi:uncharacterized protein YutE (UPF0331/DUF86 family)